MAAQNHSQIPHWRAIRLEYLQLLQVAGPDRATFLQGQLTQDMRQVSATRSALAGWADAQGRLHMVGQVMDWRDAFWISVPASLGERLAARLRLFVLRARVTINPGNMVLTGLIGPEPAAPLLLGSAMLESHALACIGGDDWIATRVAGDTQRALLAGTPEANANLLRELRVGAASASDWIGADIRAGLPAIGSETCELFIPQMVNLDLLGGVSFSKGCYTGQEIVTRTHHLGRVKRRMLRFRCAGSPGLRPGAEIFGPEREAGQVVSFVTTADGPEILAVTRLSELGGPLFADASRASRLELLDLPYLVPEAGNPPSG